MRSRYESGVEVTARSQWAYVRMRFLRHRLAVASLIVLVLIGLVGVFAPQLAPYGYDEQNLDLGIQSPTLEGWHLFGTDQLGRDYLSRVMYGIRTSLWVAIFVALVSTAIGTTVGALAGYYSGHVDNVLMRFTDLILTLPGLAVLLTASVFLGSGDPLKIGLILAFLFWTAVARIVRGLFLSLREREFVEAAKAAGASDLRIIVRHMLPNCLGPIIVNTTLVVAAAILVEAALSFLGFGIQPPRGAREARCRGTGRGVRALVARHLPGPRDRAHRALRQLRRGRPTRRIRPDSAQDPCLTPSSRSVT